MPTRRRITAAIVTGLGLSGWLLYLLTSAAVILAASHRFPRQLEWQYDWHVYLSGAQDLLQGTLYRVPLDLGRYPLPVDAFNQTPLAAVWPMPLVPLGVVAGGNVWLVLMILCIAAGMVLAAKVLGAAPPLVVGGIGLLLYSLSPWFRSDVLLGNINGLMFFLVSALAWTHCRGNDRAAGILLGLAVATKPWPLAFAPLLVRERRWRELSWAAGVLIVQSLAVLAWLGPDVLPHMVEAIASDVPIGPGVPVLGWTFIRQSFDTAGWLGPLLGTLLLVMPVGGKLGFGLAIIGGLTLFIRNLWHHYLPIIGFGLLLILGPLTSRVWQGFGPADRARLPRVGSGLLCASHRPPTQQPREPDTEDRDTEPHEIVRM